MTNELKPPIIEAALIDGLAQAIAVIASTIAVRAGVQDEVLADLEACLRAADGIENKSPSGVVQHVALSATAKLLSKSR